MTAPSLGRGPGRTGPSIRRDDPVAAVTFPG